MIPKQSKRVIDSNTIEMVRDYSEDPRAPSVSLPANERARLERLLKVSDLAIRRYEKLLTRGLDLPEADQRLLNTHINTSLKLEMAIAALDAKDKLNKLEIEEIARRMVGKGFTDDHIIKHLGDTPNIRDAIEGARE